MPMLLPPSFLPRLLTQEVFEPVGLSYSRQLYRMLPSPYLVRYLLHRAPWVLA